MKLIINADDFGLNENVNHAIVYAYQKKWITNMTILVNMPFSQQAVQLAKENRFFDKVGLHINLIEGIPLINEIQENYFFCDSLGEFRKNAFDSEMTKFFINKEDKRLLTLEIEAQIQKYLNYGFTLLHMDSHNHTHTYYSVYSVIKLLIAKYGFKSIRLSKNICRNLRVDKKLYKYLYNQSLKMLNINLSDYFTTFEDFCLIRKHYKLTSCIELECHPDYKNNVLVNKGSIMFKELFSNIIDYELVSYKDLWVK
jgi:chitin disaccharide deacetylase